MNLFQKLKARAEEGKPIRVGLNPKMFNAFLDGSKPAIEISTVFVAVAVGLAIVGIGQALCLFTPGWRPDKYLTSAKQVATG